MKALPWEILHIVAKGDVVFAERIDRFLVGEACVRIPCVGVFELRGAKITAWRNEGDRGCFERQLSAAPD